MTWSLSCSSFCLSLRRARARESGNNNISLTDGWLGHANIYTTCPGLQIPNPFLGIFHPYTNFLSTLDLPYFKISLNFNHSKSKRAELHLGSFLAWASDRYYIKFREWKDRGIVHRFIREKKKWISRYGLFQRYPLPLSFSFLFRPWAKAAPPSSIGIQQLLSRIGDRVEGLR